MAIVKGTTRTLEQVQAAIEQRQQQRQDPEAMARLMLRHGNITDDARAWLAAKAAQPFTHRVETHYSRGTPATHDTRSLAAAENYATGERRKLGKVYRDRATNELKRVERVTITAL